MTDVALLTAGVLLGFIAGLIVALLTTYRVIKNERSHNRYLKELLSEMAEIHTMKKGVWNEF